MLKDSVQAGIMFDENLDKNICSLRFTLLYTLKGISAVVIQMLVMAVLMKKGK